MNAAPTVATACVALLDHHGQPIQPSQPPSGRVAAVYSKLVGGISRRELWAYLCGTVGVTGLVSYKAGLWANIDAEEEKSRKEQAELSVRYRLCLTEMDWAGAADMAKLLAAKHDPVDPEHFRWLNNWACALGLAGRLDLAVAVLDEARRAPAYPRLDPIRRGVIEVNRVELAYHLGAELGGADAKEADALIAAAERADVPLGGWFQMWSRRGADFGFLVPPYRVAGRVAARRGRHRDAVLALEDEVAYDPAAIGAYGMIAQLCLSNGDPSRATDAIRRLDHHLGRASFSAASVTHHGSWSRYVGRVLARENPDTACPVEQLRERGCSPLGLYYLYCTASDLNWLCVGRGPAARMHYAYAEATRTAQENLPATIRKTDQNRWRVVQLRAERSGS